MLQDFAVTERPTTIDQVKGNKTVVSALKTMLNNGTLPHTILLCGNAGCGKSSLAYVIKNHLKVTDENFKIVDIGKCNSIEDIRAVCDSALSSSLFSGNRIFFLDECHKLKNQTANALLKTIEAPRSDVYFIFATTEPAVVRSFGDAFWSRLTVFTLGRLTDNEITHEIIKPVCKKYNIHISYKVACCIAEKSSGCPRTALKYLYAIHNMENEDEMLFFINIEQQDASCSVDFSQLSRNILFSDFSFDTYVRVVNMIGDNSVEAIRTYLLKVCRSVLLSPKYCKSLDICSEFVEDFKDPIYDSTLFFSKIWKFFKKMS